MVTFQLIGIGLFRPVPRRPRHRQADPAQPSERALSYFLRNHD